MYNCFYPNAVTIFILTTIEIYALENIPQMKENEEAIIIGMIFV
jgi:hypothetical protein